MGILQVGDKLKTNNDYIHPTVHTIPVVPPKTYVREKITAKADSGATRHYIRHEDAMVLHEQQVDTQGPIVTLPDNTTITASKRGQLQLSTKLSPTAKTAHVLDNLHSASLVSVGQLCDDDCKVQFSKEHVKVYKNKEVILTGNRNAEDGLWDIPLTKNNPTLRQHANVILLKNKTKQQLASYLHACCYSSSISTFMKAIKNGNFITWPGLDSKLIENHLQTPVATAKGHLDQERRNLQSTKNDQTPVIEPIEKSDSPDEFTDFFPKSDMPNVRTHDVLAVITPFKETRQAYSDQTGKFPYKSSRGNEYLLIVYDYDSNAILAEPLKSKAAASIRDGWKNIHEKLARRGVAPNLYLLDNEISHEFKKALNKYNIDYQRVPPHIHRRNAAERAIRTFKNHFLAGLATCDPQFPIYEWDRLLYQAVLTLNLLRSSRVNQNLSAWAYLFGNFDFNKTPLAPPGTRVVVHEKPQQRASWAFHGVDGWYIGPSPEHYRCVKCYITKTKSERDADTVSFHPHTIEFPEISTLDYLQQASDDILHILGNPQTAFPYLEGGEQTKNAYLKIAKLLKRATARPTEQVANNPPPDLAPQNHAHTIPPPPGFQPLPQATSTTSTESSREAEPRVQENNRPSPRVLLAEDSKHGGRALKHIIESPPSPEWLPFLYPTCNHIYDKVTGQRLTIDKLLAGMDKDRWSKALSNEWGRLAQGN